MQHLEQAAPEAVAPGLPVYPEHVSCTVWDPSLRCHPHRAHYPQLTMVSLPCQVGDGGDVAALDTR
jgi:hypothetical protein